MAKSSIHIDKGKAGFLSHNDRSLKTKNSIFSDEENEVSADNKTAFKIYREELQKRAKAYSKKTKQKLQKNAITHLSAIVNLNQHHTLKDLEPLIKHLEDTLDTKVFQVAIHRDEGHIKDGKNIKNYHAHIEFMGLDSEGNSIRRKLNKFYLQDLQTKTAELLKMERGKINSKAKRLDTYDFKNHKEREEQTLKPVLAKQKDLKAEVKKLREELKKRGATREEYAQLEQLNRELKEQIKNKDLTIDELEEKIKLLSELATRKLNEEREAHENTQKELSEAQETILKQKTTISSQKEEIEQNKQDMSLLEHRIKVLQSIAITGQETKKKLLAEKEAHENTQKELSEAQETILKQKATISSQKEEIERLKANIERLEAKVSELELELKSYRGRDRQIKRRELNTTKKALKSEEAELSSLIRPERSELSEVDKAPSISDLLRDDDSPDSSSEIINLHDDVEIVEVDYIDDVNLVTLKDVVDDVAKNKNIEKKERREQRQSYDVDEDIDFGLNL